MVQGNIILVAGAGVLFVIVAFVLLSIWGRNRNDVLRKALVEKETKLKAIKEVFRDDMDDLRKRIAKKEEGQQEDQSNRGSV
jgi:hypothetical protein